MSNEKLLIHDLFKILEDSFTFSLISKFMLAQPFLQQSASKIFGNEMIAIQTSVKFKEIDNIKFSPQYAFSNFNRSARVKQSGAEVSCNLQEMLIQQGIIISIVLYDTIQKSSYNSELNRNRLFKFAKHLRNGAAHGNTFYFKPKELRKLKEENGVYWRGKRVKHTLQNKQVFGEFIGVGDLFVLMHDLSKEFFRIDKKINKRYLN